MKKGILIALLCLMPEIAGAVSRGDAAVVRSAGTSRMAQAAVRIPDTSIDLPETTVQPTLSEKPDVPSGGNSSSGNNNSGNDSSNDKDDTPSTPAEKPSSKTCRDAYRACMDEFCLLDESEGSRCACSSNINQSKSLIQEIQDIQAEADKLYTEGVEREQLGAQARLVFGESEAAKKSSAASGINFADWINSGTDEDASLGMDSDIGDPLYAMAAEFCADRLEACGDDAAMEEMLYSRMIVQDCKSFESYLKDQKSLAEMNKRTAESAVRQARLQMLDTTNKYNRGECLLAYRSCIADKGGCGVNFENCLDADLLNRRANACENVLDQCMAVREYVLEDWQDESEMILEEAAKYADQNARNTCTARIQLCLEDSCSTATSTTCLSDINVAAGICPVIDECNELVPGLKDIIAGDLGKIRTRFCQNDIDACLRDKCGENFTAPECLGKSTSYIASLCPQDMFTSCKDEKHFDVILQAVLMQLDYQMVQGCVDYFSEQLGKVCGTDMACLPTDLEILSLTDVPQTKAEKDALYAQVRENTIEAVNEFFEQFEQDKTVAACQDSEKPSGRMRLGESVFWSAKSIAETSAVDRAERELDAKIAEISSQQSLEEAEQNCYTMYAVETPDKSSKNYSYIRSVTFEPALRNCHVCRMQQVCEEGGQDKMTGALQGVAGGLSAGASMGTMVNAGWGTLIGGVVGAVGGGLMGAAASNEETFCQQIETCEDINM